MIHKLRKLVLKELFMFEGLQIYLTRHWQITLPVLLLCEMPVLYGVLTGRVAGWWLLVLPGIWPGGFLLLLVVVGSIVSVGLQMPRLKRVLGVRPEQGAEFKQPSYSLKAVVFLVALIFIFRAFGFHVPFIRHW